MKNGYRREPDPDWETMSDIPDDQFCEHGYWVCYRCNLRTGR